MGAVLFSLVGVGGAIFCVGFAAYDHNNFATWGWAIVAISSLTDLLRTIRKAVHS